MMDGQSLSQAFIPLPGGATAVYGYSGLSYYRHPDWVGSSRLATTPSRTVYFDVAYAPYGEDYGDSGTTDVSFAGMDQTMITDLFDGMFREYHPRQGRWISPDPAGLAAGNPADPQSWNRYAYVANNPLGYVDASGLACYPLELQMFGHCPIAQPAFGQGWNEFFVLGYFYMANECDTGYCFVPTGLFVWDSLAHGQSAANNGTNCAPLTPGCSNVPTALQVKQFVQQQCLGQFNNSSLGGAVNFMSMASPVIGPNPLGSTIEDVGGTTLKYGVYQFFNSASQSMAGTPFGSMSGIVAEGIETIAKDVVLPVAVGATGLQVIAHAGCATVGGQAAGQMNPLPPGIQF